LIHDLKSAPHPPHPSYGTVTAKSRFLDVMGAFALAAAAPIEFKEMSMTMKALLAAPLMAAALASSVAMPASAAPLSPVGVASVPAATSTTADVTQVQWRRGGYGGGYGRGYYRGGGGWRNGRWIAPLVGAAIIGGAIASSDRYYDGGYRRSYYYSGGGGDAGYERCAQQFRSFDPGSGTYTTYGGQTVRCPYL
jgi:hypothetical protein